MVRGLLWAAVLLALPGCGVAQPANGPAPFALAQTIALPETKGRIDHLTIDLAGRRLFVAEVANGTVDAIDLDAGKVLGRISGLSEPQGVAWLPQQRELVVACGDGTVHFYTADRREVARIDLGGDADNVRVDARNGHVIVGYGSGGLATIDPATHRVLARVALTGHPEGFRLFGAIAYVNVPDRGAVMAADIDRSVVLARWPTGLHRLNFPLAVDPSGKTITIAYRLPAALATIDTATGQTKDLRSACGDADDLFLVGARVVLICGAGHVDVVEATGARSRIPTASGARTGLYVPELRTLFVAVPARGSPAEVRVFQMRESATTR